MTNPEPEVTYGAKKPGEPEKTVIPLSIKGAKIVPLRGATYEHFEEPSRIGRDGKARRVNRE